MPEGMEAITTRALALALDAAAMRQQVHATNIAQANAVGYQPMQLDFEEQLDAARRSLRTTGAIASTTLADVAPQPQLAEHTGVQLDLELAAMSRTTTQFQALTTALNRHFMMLNSAVSDGRR